MQRNKVGFLSYIPYTIINSNWIRPKRAQTIKLLGGNNRNKAPWSWIRQNCLIFDMKAHGTKKKK